MSAVESNEKADEHVRAFQSLPERKAAQSRTGDPENEGEAACWSRATSVPRLAAVILDGASIVSHFILPSTTVPERTARVAMEEAAKRAGLSSLSELDYIVGTGYGRLKVPFANENVSEITCHARGAHWLNPAVRTVVDIGGQDCKVMSLDKNEE
jgi:activator of 2-hydroxyglutaryl-CoA dehydratase